MEAGKHQTKLTNPEDSGDEQYIDQKSYGDSLYQIIPEQMNNPQYNILGALYSLKVQDNPPKTQVKGTAFALTSNLIATAAHNIWDFRMKRPHQKIMYYPSACGKLLKGYEIEKIYLTDNALNAKKNYAIDDFAFLKLKQNVPLKTYIPIMLIVQKEVSQMKIDSLSIFGYTKWDKDESFIDSMKYKVELRGITVHKESLPERIVKVVLNKEIHHKISTEKGQSGAPLIVKQGDSSFIIGIHKGSVVQKDNVGILFSNQMTQMLKKITSQDKIDPIRCLNATWNPFSCNDAAKNNNFEIDDNVITRTALNINKLQQIRSFSKNYRFKNQESLTIRFKDIKYAQNTSVFKFGVVLELKEKDKKVYYYTATEVNKRRGDILVENVKLHKDQPASMFVSQGETVELSISLQKNKATFKKIGGQSNIQEQVRLFEQNEIALDIFIFAQMYYKGDSLTVQF